MTSSGFDFKKFIGRETEHERFEELLKFATAARILSVRAMGGDGKSFLLKNFQHHCRTGTARIPFSFTAFDQQDYRALSLIKDIAAQLNSVGITFHNFERNERARLDENFAGITSVTNLQGAAFSGARDTQIGGIIANISQTESVNLSMATKPLSLEQAKAAEDFVIKSFFDDLHEYCTTNPIVIMLDSFEKCDDGLEHWLVNEFLERNFFSAPCESCLLVLVIAGKRVPDFYQLWPKEQCDSKIILVNELGKWTKENVAASLRAHGNDNYQPHDVDAIHGLIEKGKPLLEVVQVIEVFSNNPQEQL